MGALLLELIALIVIAIPLINFGVIQVVGIFGLVKWKILSEIVGTAVGWMFLFLLPSTTAGVMAAIILGAIASIVAMVFFNTKPEDKVEGFFEKLNNNRDNNIKSNILYNPNIEERLKTLRLYMLRNQNGDSYYRFTYSEKNITMLRILCDDFKNSPFSEKYPQVKIEDFSANAGTQQEELGIMFTSEDVIIDLVTDAYRYGEMRLLINDFPHIQTRTIPVEVQHKAAILLNDIYEFVKESLSKANPNINLDYIANTY